MSRATSNAEDPGSGNRTLLRHTCYVILGGLSGLRHQVNDDANIRLEVLRRLDDLLSVQRANGLFPFADLRGTRSPLAGVLEGHHRLWPEDFVDGWVVEDHHDGGLQFDNGVCAVTMITAYEQMKDQRYLDSSRRACEWAQSRPIVVNWNYNAFTVWALARYTQATGDRRFMPAAIERLQLGVLPGQLPGGRWMDPHNARTVYHAILLRAMAELYVVLDAEAPIRSRLEVAIRRADRVLVEEICKFGATDADHSLTALCAVARAVGVDPQRSEAIRIIGNAMYAPKENAGEDQPFHDLSLLAGGTWLDCAKLLAQTATAN